MKVIFEYRKHILFGLIAFTFLPLLFIVNLPNYSGLNSDTVGAYTTLFGSLIGLFGLIILFWQSIIGFRGLWARLFVDLVWINSLHKFFGIYAVLTIFLHPVLTFIGYELNSIHILRITFEGANNPLKQGIILGEVALILLIIAIFSGTLARKDLGFRVWKYLHFLNYLIFPLVVIHARQIGTLMNLSDPLSDYALILLYIFIAFTIFRILFHFGLTRSRYELSKIEDVTYNVKRFVFKPLGNKLTPVHGQFVYLQPSSFSTLVKNENHPFSISHYNKDTGELSVTIKEDGKFTKMLFDMKVGDNALLDGPYGVFTLGINDDEADVFIAGGIGIAPFIYGVESSPENTYLFYANQTYKDIAFLNEFRATLGDRLVNVLNKDKVEGMEEGYITVELMRKYLGDDLTKYKYYVCGPPPMMDAIIPELIKNGVSSDSIYSEKFSL